MAHTLCLQNNLDTYSYNLRCSFQELQLFFQAASFSIPQHILSSPSNTPTPFSTFYPHEMARSVSLYILIGDNQNSGGIWWFIVGSYAKILPGYYPYPSHGHLPRYYLGLNDYDAILFNNTFNGYVSFIFDIS